MICLGAAALSACETSSSPNATPAPSTVLSNADLPTVKGAGASTAPAGQVSGPVEDAPVVATLYREGHEIAVLRAIGILVGLIVVATLFTVGIPRRMRWSAVVRSESDRSRQSRAA